MISTYMNLKDEKENNSIKMEHILSEPQINMLNLFKIVVYNDFQANELKNESLQISPSKSYKNQEKNGLLHNYRANLDKKRNYYFQSEKKIIHIKSIINKKEFDKNYYSLGSKFYSMKFPSYQSPNCCTKIPSIFQNARIKSQVNKYLLLRKSKTVINQISLFEKNKYSKKNTNNKINQEKNKIKRLCDSKSVIEMISKNNEKILSNQIPWNKNPYIINRKPIYSHHKNLSMMNSSSIKDKFEINQSSYRDT